MLPQKIYIDSSLLVLLVVGETDKRLISKHRRLEDFQEEDYERLTRLINKIDQVFVTPNTLTEASNLLAQHKDPERSRFFAVLRTLIERSEEIFVASETASHNNQFKRLGLTDAVLLEVISNSSPVVTTDLKLYLAATRNEAQSALNFWHSQSLA